MPEGAVVIGFVAGFVYNAASALLLKLQVRPALKNANSTARLGDLNNSCKKKKHGRGLSLSRHLISKYRIFRPQKRVVVGAVVVTVVVVVSHISSLQ